MFNKHKKLVAKRKKMEQEKRVKKLNQQKKNNKKSKKSNQPKNKRPPQLAVTVLLDSKTGTVSVATNFRSLPLTRGMLEQATDNVRQINTIKLNQMDAKADAEIKQRALHKQKVADAKSDKENKGAMHEQMRKNE